MKNKNVPCARQHDFWGYDLSGIAAFNAVAAYAYANSALGIATNETATIGGKVFTLTRGLDDRHRLAGLALSPLPLGESQGEGTAPYSVAYAYDNEGRLATVSNDIFVAEYAYTPDGYDAGYTVRLTSGAVLTRLLVRDTYRRGLIKAITNLVNDMTLNPLAYDYDVPGRPITRNADTFGYNIRSEVTSATIASNAATYAYDNIGNHTTSAVNSAATTYAANALNQYTSILCAPAPLREPSYDLDGNLLTNGVWSYAWDAENRLVAAYSNGVCVVSNAYDHASRRVQKFTPSATHIFIYDGWNLIMEIQHSNIPTFQSSTNHFVWGKDLSGTLQGAGGVGGLLAISLSGTWYFPFYDNNGNITAYVDENGVTAAAYTYDAFGATISQSGVLADAFPYRFSTKYHDPETGLYYYGYRFYDPVLHRWLNRDPIEENGGFDLYAFCGNIPIGRFDIHGCVDGEVMVEGAGIGLLSDELILNGKTAIRLGDDLFYVTGEPKPGMWVPRKGTDSHLLIYKAENPKKVFRLDYHAIEESAGKPVYHYNKTSGFAKITGLKVLNHATPPSARFTGRSITLFKSAGRGLFIVGAATSAYDVYRAENRVREITRQVGGWSGAWAGGLAGARAGIKVGVGIAVILGNSGPQALIPEEAASVPVGAVLGGAIGGIGGGLVGWIAGTSVAEKVYDLRFVPLSKEEWKICNEKN